MQVTPGAGQALFSVQQPRVERGAERQIDHSVVEDSLGDKLAKEEELAFDLILVAGLGVASQGQRIKSGRRVDVLHTLLVNFADVVLRAG